jgi:tetratricopeptide (TPR) repeat protein
MKAIKLTVILAINIALALLTACNNPYLSVRAGYNLTPEDTLVIGRYLKQLDNYTASEKYRIEYVRAYLDSAYTYIEKRNIPVPAQLYLYNAGYNYNTGDFKLAEDEALKALESAREDADYTTMARVMVFLGAYYLKTGFYQESIDYYAEATELCERYNIIKLIARAYNGQASVYQAAGDLKSYRQSLEAMINSAIEEADTASLMAGLLRLGTKYADTTEFRNYRMADSLLRFCVRVSLRKKDTYFTAFASANLGWNFYVERMYDSSIYQYEKALKYSLMGSFYGTAANSLGNLATIYSDLKQYSQAESYYTKSIKYARLVNDYYTLSWVHNDMHLMYLKQNDTTRAFKAFKLYKHFNDSLMITKNTQGLSDARIRYEADNNRKEFQLLSLKLYNQRLLIYGFALFTILTLTIGYLLQRASRLKAKRRISDMNRQISEITQANLRQQMNPHFIFNTLNSIQYYMYQHDKLATNNYLTKFSNLMRKVLENSQHTSVPLSDELAALNLYLELESLRFKDRFDYTVRVDEEIDPMMFKVPTMLIQPYVENSITHGLMPGKGKGSVTIEIKSGKDCLICIIEDNGIGRDAAREKNGKSDLNHNSLGTRITNSRLDLVNSLYGTSLKTIYTDLRNDSGEATGTRVEIHIPIMI